MSTARLTTGFWVDAYLTRARQETLPVYVAARGDDTAGVVLIKVATMDGQARAFQRIQGLDGRRWDVLSEGAEHDVDAAIARQRAFDPDLWVLEVEDRAGRHLLEEDGFRD